MAKGNKGTAGRNGLAVPFEFKRRSGQRFLSDDKEKSMENLDTNVEENMTPNIVDTKKETDKKCPQCGGIMDFDPAVGMLHCPYCDYKEEIPVENEEVTSVEEADFLTAEQTGNCEWGVETKTVFCKACGGEMVYDALQIAGECPYCGSNQVMEAKGRDTLAPGGVCVFKIDAKGASERFGAWIKRKWFCPNAAKDSARPKDMKGVYLPYWTFDTNTKSSYSAEYGIVHTETKKNGEKVTRTDWYNCKGKYDKFIDDEPVCATKQHDQALLKGVLPFNTADNLLYKPEYVAGFASERYSIGLKDAWETAKASISSELKSNITSKIQSDHHADSVRSLRIRTEYNNIKYKYLLLPVWMSYFKYNDKLYHFMVNGQNGKVSGRTPISAVKVAIAVGIGILVCGLLWWISNL